MRGGLFSGKPDNTSYKGLEGAGVLSDSRGGKTAAIQRTFFLASDGGPEDWIKKE